MASAALRCPFCGQPVSKDLFSGGATARCPHCGHAVAIRHRTIPSSAASTDPVTAANVTARETPLLVGRPLIAAACVVGGVGLVALLLGLTILPPVTTALLRTAELLNPAGILIGLLGLITCAIGFGLFLYADRRYSQRCPQCGQSVPGPYYLGKRCTCGNLLHPWLTVEYKP